MTQKIQIRFSRNDSYNVIETVEIGIEVPDVETSIKIYEGLRNDARRLEDAIRERLTVELQAGISAAAV